MNDNVTMGKLGEQVFLELFGGVQSADEFDKIKDIVLDGRHVEVKAQNRHPTKHVFAIRDAYVNEKGNIVGVDNIIKCFSVERLVFVEYDHTSVIKLWECPLPRKYIKYTTSKQLAMIGFPISQMKLLISHEDAELANKFRALSQSKVFKK